MELLKKFQDEVVISTFPEIAEPDSTVRIEAWSDEGSVEKAAETWPEYVARRKRENSSTPSTQNPSASAPIPSPGTNDYYLEYKMSSQRILLHNNNNEIRTSNLYKI
eukprot:GHVP01028842.1.p1 GENE.GHVP01028842.1~~GHVP01028842.1.p1  ORF type:complete len:107 (-),score=25.77 GHVP01028842.1:751-1071(-)